METVKLELNASKRGWNCSGCGLFFDSIGRPIFGEEVFTVVHKGTAWLENRPHILYCPKCGRKVEE